MITAEEIYYLNRALNGEEIYGIKPKISLNNIQNTISSLKVKKIIDENEKINDFSYLILRNLEQYKNAREYLWVNDIALSLDRSNSLIFFSKNNNEEFDFKKTTKELMLLAIVKEFKFLQENRKIEGNKVESKIEEVTNIDEMLNFLKEKEIDKVLFFKKTREKDIIEYLVYYDHEGYIYKYDVLRKVKSKVISKQVRREIAILLNIRLEE